MAQTVKTIHDQPKGGYTSRVLSISSMIPQDQMQAWLYVHDTMGHFLDAKVEDGVIPFREEVTQDGDTTYRTPIMDVQCGTPFRSKDGAALEVRVTYNPGIMSAELIEDYLDAAHMVLGTPMRYQPLLIKFENIYRQVQKDKGKL